MFNTKDFELNHSTELIGWDHLLNALKIERNSKQLDLSHILAPIIPHSESVSPTTVGNLNPYFDIFDSYYKGHDDKQGYTFNMPGLDNFKEFISYNGKF